MVSSTLCPAVHILGSQNVYCRAEGIADHYWPWAVFFPFFLPFLSFPSFLGSGPVGDDDLWHHHIGGFSPFFLFLFNL